MNSGKFNILNMKKEMEYGSYRKGLIAALLAVCAPVVVIILCDLLIVGRNVRMFYIDILGLAIAFVSVFIMIRILLAPVYRTIRLINQDGNQDKFHDSLVSMVERWNHLKKENQSLQQKVKQNMGYLRDGYLMQMVQGHLYSLTEIELENQLSNYGWNTDHKQHKIVLFNIMGLSDPNGKFIEKDKELATFTVSNVIDELANEDFRQYHVINFHDMSIGLLVSEEQSASENQFKSLSYSFCYKVIEQVQNLLDMKITISISSQTNHIKNVPLLFQEARQSFNYRDMYTQNQILDTTVNGTEQQEYEYPFALEKKIIHSIRLGLVEDTEELIEQFLYELGSKKWIIQQGMFLLMGSILHTLLNSGMSTNLMFLGNANTVFEELFQLREPEEILQWFKKKAIGPLVKELHDNQNVQLKQMIENVIVHMREHYMTDISLDYCADMMSTSPYALSKAFKQIIGINFIDYLTDIRISKAKDLLRNTDIKINNVADQVGYQHSYFTRIFKRNEGLTPSQYREMTSKRASD